MNEKQHKINLIINAIKDAEMITFEEFYAKYTLYQIRLGNV